MNSRPVSVSKILNEPAIASKSKAPQAPMKEMSKEKVLSAKKAKKTKT